MNTTNLVRCAVPLLLLGACGTAGPAELEELEAGGSPARAAPGERVLPPEDEPRFSGFVGRVDALEDTSVEKQFIDDSLSCNVVPGLTCPDILLSDGNGEIVLVDRRDPRFDLIFQRNPPVTVRETLPARPAGVTLDTISCGPRSGSIVYVDIFSFRLPVEVEDQVRQVDARTISFGTSVFPSNYPDGTMSTFTCLPRPFSLSAPGFRSQAPQFQGEFLAARMVRDGDTPNDGEGNYEITCGYTVASAQIAADRPRDVLESNNGGFVTAATLSPSQVQQRCNNLCFDDCSVTFGVDALGAQFCTDACIPDCVSRATTNTELCSSPGCFECSQQSDCGSPAEATCSGGCCLSNID